MYVASFGKVRLNPIYFVSEEDANRKPRLPVEDIDGPDAGLHSRNFEAFATKPVQHGNDVPVVLPGYGLFRAKRRFADLFLRRRAGNAAQIEPL